MCRPLTQLPLALYAIHPTNNDAMLIGLQKIGIEKHTPLCVEELTLAVSENICGRGYAIDSKEPVLKGVGYL